MGVVILNALASPRSGFGDTAVYWAESFASIGYPCFRVDMPGLGDSRGDLPTELLPFITDGGYASLMELKLKELVQSFGLSGVIVMGHCAGGVTAIHAASENRACDGLILIDPYFNYPRRITRMLPRIGVLSRKSKAFRVLRHTYDFARELPRALRRDRLPGSANRPLLRKWKRVASSGVPILILGSSGLKAGAGQFDYLDYALKLAGRKSAVTVEFIEEADHSFANLAGRDAARRHAERWLSMLDKPAAQAVQHAS
jgi:pimeloyl-ACP methyl ester carboxylesterase